MSQTLVRKLDIKVSTTVKTRASFTEVTISCKRKSNSRHRCKNCLKGKNFKMTITVLILILMKRIKKLLRLRLRGSFLRKTISKPRLYWWKSKDTTSQWHSLFAMTARYQAQALSCVHVLMKWITEIVTSLKNQIAQIHLTKVLKHSPAVRYSNLAMGVRKP